MADKTISKMNIFDDLYMLKDAAAQELLQEHYEKIETLTSLIDDLYHLLNKDVVPGIIYFSDQPISKLYCGTTNPDNNIGNDGDIYIKY